MEHITRSEHVAWCKKRALEYLPSDPSQAVASMISDMGKHPDTRSTADPFLSMLGMMEIEKGPEAVRRWVEGFN